MFRTWPSCTRIGPRAVVAFVLAVYLAALPSAARGEDPPKEGEKPTGPEVHKVYVPYRDLQKVFEKEGQGVFVPYAEFRALWEKAYRMPDDPSRPPVNAAVRSADYAGVADGETVRFTAQIEVEVLAKGWQRVALDFGGVGVEQATIAGEPALLVPTEKGYDLVLEGQGRRTLDLVLRVAAPAQGDSHVAEMALPPVPLARLALRVPGTDTDVQVSPRLAGSSGPTADGMTELLAYLGPVSKVKLSWRRKPDEGPKLDPLVFAQETTDVLVDRGVVRTDASATLSILRAPLETLTLVVPKDAVVLYVDGQGIKAWERSADGATIKVTLREPVRETWAVRVGLERALAALPAEVALPLVGVDGLERESGFLRLRAAEGVKVDPRAVPGLVQVDLKDLPAPLQGAVAGGKAFGWRHPARLGAVTAMVEALAPRLSASLGNRIGIRPEGVEVTALAAVTVERAGVFGVSFDVPAALEVTSVTLAGAELDDWTRVPGAAGRQTLRVAFRDRLLGSAQVLIAGRLPLALPEEEGKEAALDVPLVSLLGAQHVRGYVALHADAALDRRETARTGLTALEADVPAVIEPPGLPGAALPLAARFEHREGAVALALSLKRKAATLTGEVETGVRLEADRTRLSVLLRWKIEFRGVDTLRFRGPLSLAGRVHLRPGLVGMDLLEPEKEAKPEGAPDTWQATRGTWTLKLSAPRLGILDVPLVVDDKPETTLTAGGSRRVSVPVFVPVEADGKPLANVRLSASVQRDPLLEVATETVEKGEEIDARELPATLASGDAFLAFRSFDPEHAVSLLLTKHEYEPVAEVVVSHMHLDSVVPAEGRGTTEAYLVVRNNDRQTLEVKLPPGANIRAVHVDGKPETPRRGDDGHVLIPLQSGMRKDQAFLVALVYDHEIERGGALFEQVTLVSPQPQGVSSDLLTWRVFTPRRKDREVTGFGGDVSAERERGSWALRLLENVNWLLKREQGGRPLDLARLVRDVEKGSPFQIPHDGEEWLFSNRLGTGNVSLTFANPTTLAWLRILALVAGFLAARLLVRLARGLGQGPLAAFLVPALVLVGLLIPAQRGAAQLINAALVGLLLSGAVSFVGWLASPRRPRRAPAAPPPEAAPPTDAAPAGGGA